MECDSTSVNKRWYDYIDTDICESYNCIATYDTDKKEIQTINGIGIVNNSPNAKVDLVDLRAENKALKMVIEEKDKRLAEQQKYIDQLGKRLDLVLQLGHNSDTGM